MPNRTLSAHLFMELWVYIKTSVDKGNVDGLDLKSFFLLELCPKYEIEEHEFALFIQELTGHLDASDPAIMAHKIRTFWNELTGIDVEEFVRLKVIASKSSDALEDIVHVLLPFRYDSPPSDMTGDGHLRLMRELGVAEQYLQFKLSTTVDSIHLFDVCSESIHKLVDDIVENYNLV